MTNPTSSQIPSPRLLRYVVAVIAASVPAVAGAILLVTQSPPSARVAASVAVFALAALVSELKPVPVGEHGTRTVSLSFVFLLSAQLLFGWQYGVLASVLATGVVGLTDQAPVIRRVFNSAMYALAVTASAIPGLLLGVQASGLDPLRSDRLTVLAFTGGALYVVTNVLLVSIAVSLATGVRLHTIVDDNVRHSGPAFVIMACIAGVAASLWLIRPQLEVLLAGPLFALALYQRYAYRTVLATRDAETDGLTGLGNHRSFQIDLNEALALASSTDGTVSLCVIDLDDFKSINDRYGHPIGDQVLQRLADLLREQFGADHTYRIGGEEFAVVMSGIDAKDAYPAVERLHHGLWETEFEHGEQVTVSVGIAGYPENADDRDELLRVADGALYWAKNHGKNRSCIYTQSVVRIFSPQELAQTAERSARLRAAEGLIRVVDAKDTYAGAHSQSVSRLAEGIARSMGLQPEVVEQVRLAGLLHDLGKIAIPDAILQKPGRLEPDELRTMREHAELGYRLLEGLGVSPVDRWIRHHHEWWDGSGYPLGLAGEEIPLGSRIILVADAFDAMTSDRVYRAAGTAGAAVAELRRRCWGQFDARVVAALEEYLVSPSCHLTGGAVAPESATG
jgi:diguanylate cyclase (GGDEF)-like protein/putative nucleotidyltransferase with HDIG domain